MNTLALTGRFQHCLVTEICTIRYYHYFTIHYFYFVISGLIKFIKLNNFSLRHLTKSALLLVK